MLSHDITWRFRYHPQPGPAACGASPSPTRADQLLLIAFAPSLAHRSTRTIPRRLRPVRRPWRTPCARANQSVIIHSHYARSDGRYCGAMILGSDSHTRYGASAPWPWARAGRSFRQQPSAHVDVDLPEVVSLAFISDGQVSRRGVGLAYDVALRRRRLRLSSSLSTACWNSPAPASPVCPSTSATASTP